MNIGALIATLGVNTAGLIQAQKDMAMFEKRAVASISRVNARLMTTGKTMKKFGRSATMYMTLPLLLVGGAAFKMHKDFEASMSKIIGLVGVARAQVDQWGEEIIRIAPKLGKAPKELAEALFFITSAGIRGAEAMDVLTMSAKASASGLGEVKVVADLVTSAMNAYGIATLSAEAATDVLTATVREGKAEATALASTMGMVLPIASNMGVAFHEIGGAVAAMTRTGTSAATASMQLRQILASLLKPTQQAEKALWGMDTSAAALRKTIREKGLLAALMDIRALTAKYGETVMSTVFPNIRALSGVLDIMGANLEDNIKIFKSLEEAAGSSAKAFGAAAETVEHKWNVAMASAKTAMTVLGGTVSELLIPIIEKFAVKIQRLIMWFDNLRNSQKQMIVKIAGLLAVIGPLSIALGFLVGNVLPGLIRVGFGAVKMFNALRIAMLSNPITAVAIGIAALAVALIPFRKRTMEATEAQNDFNESLKNTEEIARRKKIQQLLRDIGLLKVGKITTQFGVTLEFEKLDVSQKALSKLAKTISELPVAYLKGVKTLIAEEIIELKRGLESYVASGDSLLDQVTTATARKEIKALQNALTGVIAELEKAAKIEVLENITIISAEVTTVMKELQTNLDSINRLFEYQGDVVDVAGRSIEAYEQTLEMLARLGLPKTHEAVIKVLGGIQELGGATSVLNAIMKQMTKDLMLQEKLHKLSGETYELAAKQLQIYSQVLEQLTRVGFAENSDAIKYIQSLMVGLSNTLTGSAMIMEEVATQLAKVTQMESRFGDSFDDVSASIQIYNAALQQLIAMEELDMEAIGSIIEKLKELESVQNMVAEGAGFFASFIGSAFQGMSNVIADSLNSTEGFLKSFASFFKDFIKGMIFRLIAATIAALALAVVLAMIFPGGGGGAKIFKNLAKVSTFGETFKAGLSAFSGIGLAEGGIVTRPTLALIGERGPEAVVPLNRMASQPISPQTVKFVIEQDQLVGILEMYNNRKNNF